MNKREATRIAWSIVLGLVRGDLEDYESDYIENEEDEDLSGDRYSQEYGEDAQQVREAMDVVLAEMARRSKKK